MELVFSFLWIEEKERKKQQQKNTAVFLFIFYLIESLWWIEILFFKKKSFRLSNLFVLSLCCGVLLQIFCLIQVDNKWKRNVESLPMQRSLRLFFLLITVFKYFRRRVFVALLFTCTRWIEKIWFRISLCCLRYYLEQVKSDFNYWEESIKKYIQ